MVRATTRTVTVSWILVKNAGILRKRSIVERSVPHHVVREEADMVAIHPVGHPNHLNCPLLLSVHHQLHRAEADNNVLLQHLIPAHLVLLARAALAAHLQPHNLHKDARRMNRRMDLHLYCRRHLRIVKKNGRGCHIWRRCGRSDLLHRCACAASVMSLAICLQLEVLDLSTRVTKGDFCLQACALLPQRRI